MVLDKFKDFVKGEDKKNEKTPGKGRDIDSPVPPRDEGPGNGPGTGTEDSGLEPKKNRRNQDLGMPTENDIDNLPDMPENMTDRPRSGGRGTREGRERGGSRRSTGNRNNLGTGSRRPPRTPNRNSNPRSPRNERGGNVRNRPRRTPENVNSDEALRRILDKLEDIDRKLDSLQRR